MKKWIVLILLLGLAMLCLSETGQAYSRLAQYKLQHKMTYQYVNGSKNKTILPWYTQKIPFKIHQTSNSNKVDYKIGVAAMNNQNLNPEYDYFFYNEADRLAFIETNFPEYAQDYNSIKPGAYKADLFRYLLLFKEGGLYMDDKTFCVRPLREILTPDDELYFPRDVLPGCVQQGIIGSTPGHPLMKQIIERYITNIRDRKYGINCWDIGGPQMVGRVVNRFLGNDELALIEPFSHNGLRIEDIVKNMGSDIIILDRDGKTILFERGNSSYMHQKAKNILTGKDYKISWMLGKVYQ